MNLELDFFVRPATFLRAVEEAKMASKRKLEQFERLRKARTVNSRCDCATEMMNLSLLCFIRDKKSCKHSEPERRKNSIEYHNARAEKRLLDVLVYFCSMKFI